MNNRNVITFLLALAGLFTVAPILLAQPLHPPHPPRLRIDLDDFEPRDFMRIGPRPSHLPIGPGEEGDDNQLAERLQASQDLLNMRDLLKNAIAHPEQFNLAGKERFLEKLLEDRNLLEKLKDPQVAKLLRSVMDNPNLTDEERQTLRKMPNEISPDEWKKLADTMEQHPERFGLLNHPEKLEQLIAQMKQGQSPENGPDLLQELLRNPKVGPKTIETLNRLVRKLPPLTAPLPSGNDPDPASALPNPMKSEQLADALHSLDGLADKSSASSAAGGSAAEVKAQLADWLADTLADDARADYLADMIRQMIEGDPGENSFMKETLDKSIDWLGMLRPGEWLPIKQARSVGTLFDNISAPVPSPSFGNSSSLLPALGGSGNFLPDLSSLSSDDLSRPVFWGVAAAVFGFAAWLLVKRYRAFLAARASGIPHHWPVRPKDVATRGDLVRAFEYLALLCLGLDAKHRHHWDLADRLGGPERRTDDSRRLAAQHLAYLYELARYAPEDESLPEAEMAAARRDLSFLAGAGAA